MKLSDQLDEIRHKIISEGYDRYLDYEDLDNLFKLSNKLKEIEK